jgi:crossover junction endodeoxyribonuclease RuvC
MRVIGIDPALRSTGFGIVDSDGHRFQTVAHGVIASHARDTHGACLDRIESRLAALLEQHRPDSAALESLFYCRNVRTAITLGEARGVVLLGLSRFGLPIEEYAPRRVKLAVVGRGSATKDQVSLMVRRILGIRDDIPDDASDALAVAICHIHQAHSPVGT